MDVRTEIGVRARFGDGHAGPEGPGRGTATYHEGHVCFEVAETERVATTSTSHVDQWWGVTYLMGVRV